MFCINEHINSNINGKIKNKDKDDDEMNINTFIKINLYKERWMMDIQFTLNGTKVSKNVNFIILYGN